MALMVQTTQRCFEVHQPILRVLTKTLFIAGYSTTTTTNIYLQEWVGSVKGRKVLSQRLVPYTNSMKRKHSTMMRGSENGLTSQTVGRFQMGANILLKPAPHPWWLLASISWCIRCCSDGLAARAPAERCAHHQNWRTPSRPPATHLKVT